MKTPAWMVIAFDGFALSCIVLLLALRVLTPDVGVPMLSLLLGAGAMRRASSPVDGSAPKLPPSAALAVPILAASWIIELLRARHQ